MTRKLKSTHRWLRGSCTMCGQSEHKTHDAICQPVPSVVVASYIRFDNQQQPINSWHCLQDCLEELRKIEAKQAADSRTLAAVRENLTPLIPVLRQMESSGFTPHELQGINAAELLKLIDPTAQAGE